MNKNHNKEFCFRATPKGIFMKKLYKWFIKHPIFGSLSAALFLCIPWGILRQAGETSSFHSPVDQLLYVLILCPFLVYPLVLTLLNLLFFGACKKGGDLLRASHRIEYAILLLGSLLTLLLLCFSEIRFADWQTVLYNQELHTPVATASVPTIAVLLSLAAAGYLILTLIPLKKLSPLITVFSLSGMYLGAFLCIVWIVQVLRWELVEFYLCLLPFNVVLIVGKRTAELVLQWNREGLGQNVKKKGKQGAVLQRLEHLLNRSENWPWLALIGIFPLLGASIAVLALFGQQPDAMIRAWTQTSDWNLSTQVSPQNIYVDEHYLCTVAAGGHRKIVKPLRMGIRHGRRVIVNRQLCIANAFEQILEERTPRFHHAIRRLYDRHGYPIAKHIHSPYAADIVYFVMKPLEWLFLVILYCCDCQPENRIAVQYFPKIPGIQSNGKRSKKAGL